MSRLLGSNLPRSNWNGLTSIWTLGALSHGSPTDRGAPIVRFERETPPPRHTSSVSSLTDRPLDRSSTATTCDRAQRVGAIRTIMTQSITGVSKTPEGTNSQIQQNRRCFMGIPPELSGRSRCVQGRHGRPDCGNRTL